MSLPRYPEYKESGLAWLGELPAHWKLTPLKRGFEVCLGKMLQSESSGVGDSLLPYLRAANIQWAGVDFTDIKSMWFSQRERIQLKLVEGDLLVSEGGDVGRSCVWKNEIHECYIQNSVNRVRPNLGNDTQFLYYWMVTLKSKGYVDVLCNKSTIAHFTAEKIAEVPVPLPPPSEQTAIATFLDRETAKIDALIAEQEKLLTLLAEKRQATISHAVTKGLNPDVPMKDSGVEWLGEVPDHWEVVGFTKYIKSVVDYRGKTPTKVDEGVFLVTAKNIRDGKVDYEASQEYVALDEYEEIMRRGLPQLGDVLFTTEAPLGQVAQVDRTDIALAQRVIKFQADESYLDNGFIKYWVIGSHCQFNLELLATGSTALGIKGSKIGQIRLLLPPKEEQIQIVKFLDDEFDRHQELRREATLAIDLLKERRTALISAAVTGKIDVRHLANQEAA